VQLFTDSARAVTDSARAVTDSARSGLWPVQLHRLPHDLLKPSMP